MLHVRLQFILLCNVKSYAAKFYCLYIDSHFDSYAALYSMQCCKRQACKYQRREFRQEGYRESSSAVAVFSAAAENAFIFFFFAFTFPNLR
jgi:hypothetical protein